MASRQNRRPVRKTNIRKLAQLCHRMGPLPRAALAREMKLTIPAVTEMVALLEGEGVLRPVGPGPSSGGRRPLEYAIDPGYRHILVVTAAGDLVQVALADLTPQKRESTQFRFPAGGSSQALFERLVEVIGTLQRKAGFAPHTLGAFIISTPGIIDRKEKSITTIRHQHVKIADKQLQKQLRALYAVPFRVENNTNLEALGEYALEDSGEKNLSVVRIGPEGLGAGHILNGRLYEGGLHSVGELGYLPAFAASGRHQTLEQYLIENVWGKEETEGQRQLYVELWSYVIRSVYAVIGADVMVLSGYAPKLGPAFLDALYARMDGLLPVPVRLRFASGEVGQEKYPDLLGAFTLGAQVVLDKIAP